MLMLTGACLCSFLCRNGPVKITSSKNDPKKKLGHVGEYSFSCTRGAISCLPAVVAVDGRLSDYVRWEFKQCVR